MVRITLLATIALGLQIQSGLAADAAHGQQLALRWCAACHAVTPEAGRVADVPPPFANVASGLTSMQIAWRFSCSIPTRLCQTWDYRAAKRRI